MPDTTLPAIPHFMRRPALWDAFVTKITRVGILRFRQFLDNPLLSLCRFLDPLPELIPGSMFIIRLSAGDLAARREHTFPMLPFQRSWFDLMKQQIFLLRGRSKRSWRALCESILNTN
jgi:hypothetical protein